MGGKQYCERTSLLVISRLRRMTIEGSATNNDPNTAALWYPTDNRSLSTTHRAVRQLVSSITFLWEGRLWLCGLFTIHNVINMLFAIAEVFAFSCQSLHLLLCPLKIFGKQSMIKPSRLSINFISVALPHSFGFSASGHSPRGFL